MQYFQKGHGEYLVLVHGGLTDGAMWLPHIDILAEHFHVIAVTLSHFDNAENRGFGLNSHAEELRELVAKLALEKAVNIVAWSYGADVVLNMMTSFPLSLSRVFLYEPGYPGCVQEHDMKTWAADAETMFGPVFHYVQQGELNLATAALIDGSGNCQGYFNSQATEVKNLQLAKAYTLPLQLQQQEQPLIDVQSLSKLATPLIFCYGEQTRALFRLATVSNARATKQAELLAIEQASHMLPQENPEKFSNLIIDLFRTKT